MCLNRIVVVPLSTLLRKKSPLVRSKIRNGSFGNSIDLFVLVSISARCSRLCRLLWTRSVVFLLTTLYALSLNSGDFINDAVNHVSISLSSLSRLLGFAFLLPACNIPAQLLHCWNL